MQEMTFTGAEFNYFAQPSLLANGKSLLIGAQGQ